MGVNANTVASYVCVGASICGGSESVFEFSNLGIDQIAYPAHLVYCFSLRVRDMPIKATFCGNEWTCVTTPHRYHGIILQPRDVSE
jgi:hypothetical protein